jgi:hypothetical protein
MLWEALTGARLWAKRPELDILKSLVDKKIPALPDSAASQPAELREMVRRATSADPSERYATAKEFRELIEQYLARTGPYRSVTDLGLRLRETFADDGEKLRRILEDHASAAAGTVGDVPKLELRRVPNPPPPPASATTSARDAAPKASQPLQPSVASQPSSAADASDSRPRVASAAASGPYPAAAARPSKSNKTPWVFAALGIALAGGAVVYATSAKNEDIRTAPSPSVGQSAGDRATSQSNVESEWVDVTITTVPTGATIFIDGQPAPTNPYKVHEKRGARHSINVQAPGYLPLMKDVAFDTNLYLPIALEVLPEGGLVVTGSLRKPTASASASASAPASPSSSAAPRSPALHGLTMPRDVPGPR